MVIDDVVVAAQIFWAAAVGRCERAFYRSKNGILLAFQTGPQKGFDPHERDRKIAQNASYPPASVHAVTDDNGLISLRHDHRS